MLAFISSSGFSASLLHWLVPHFLRSACMFRLLGVCVDPVFFLPFYPWLALWRLELPSVITSMQFEF